MVKINIITKAIGAFYNQLERLWSPRLWSQMT